MASKKKNEAGLGTAIGLGVGLAALAGAYFLYGKDGAKNKKKIKSWMLKAKGDVLSKLEKMKDVSEEKYQGVVGEVVQKYGKMKDVDTGELEMLARDLQGHWKNIKKELDASAQSVKKAKPAIKKAAKDVKKAVKK